MNCPNCGTELQIDARTQDWRVRIRLYLAGSDTPSADTDPELPNDAAGETVINSLPAVASYLREVAESFHAAPCDGLGDESLRLKLNSLRPTLARRKQKGLNNAVWRVPYKAGGQSWLARVDIERVGNGTGGQTEADQTGA